MNFESGKRKVNDIAYVSANCSKYSKWLGKSNIIIETNYGKIKRKLDDAIDEHNERWKEIIENFEKLKSAEKIKKEEEKPVRIKVVDDPPKDLNIDVHENVVVKDTEEEDDNSNKLQIGNIPISFKKSLIPDKQRDSFFRRALKFFKKDKSKD